MLRGINKQQIFYDDEDFSYFIALLDKYKAISHYDVYAYCLMRNHVHLLIKISDEPLETIFRRLGASFVYWYNLKYERTGHLFQDRFKSEPVEDDRYFLAVLRYILRNPVKAGICATPAEYAYSNIRDFSIPSKNVLPCPLESEELWDFIMQDGEDDCLDVLDQPQRRVTDTAARELIRQEFGALPADSSAAYRAAVQTALRRLAQKGLTIRQLSRLTGIAKSSVDRALKS